MSLKFEQQIISLKKFATAENISIALQIYKKQDIQAFIEYSNNTCSAAIEQKITKDLQIMKNKFDPKHDFGNVRLSNITVQDFNGKKHTVPEDYLATIGKDKQVLNYINPNSAIAKEISSQLKQTAEIKQSQGIKIKVN